MTKLDWLELAKEQLLTSLKDRDIYKVVNSIKYIEMVIELLKLERDCNDI